MKCQYVFVVSLMSTIIISSASEDITDSINLFANKLYNVLSTDATASDLVFSPFSAHSALSLTYLGAAGKTAESLERALYLPEINETLWGYRDITTALRSVQNVNIKTANRIYVMTDYQLKEEFHAIAENYFSAGVENINFAQGAGAAKEINDWCKNTTYDKIDRLVSAEDLNGDTRAVILNAVYFKGNWLHTFDKELTLKARFHTSGDEDVDCEMMYQTGRFEYGVDETLDAKILKMRYEDERFSMVVVLPNRKDGLEELEGLLRSRNLTSFELEREDIEVQIPKFKIDSTLELNDPLSKLGLEEIFSFSADFSNLLQSPSEPLKVDKVLQKAFIEVNEDGSEAAASTAVEIISRFGGENDVLPTIFRADHPFIFYIAAELEATTILFMGKVGRPRT